MDDIVCPHCKKTFKVDEAGFADILKQVRNSEFEKDIHDRLCIAEKEKQNAISLTEANLKNSAQAEIAAKDKLIAELKAEKDLALANLLSQKESEIVDMRSKLEKADLEKKLAVTDAVNVLEKERDDLAGKLEIKEVEKSLLEKNLNEKFTAELKTKDGIIQMKDEEIALRKDMKMKLSTKML